MAAALVEADAHGVHAFAFNHPDDLGFWKTILPVSAEDPTEQDQKTFANIRDLIESEFPNAPQLDKKLNQKNLKFLKRCFIVDDEDGLVGVRSFVRMTKWFGPFTRTADGNSCTFLEQVHTLSKHTVAQSNDKVSPFAGWLTRDGAQELLAPGNIPTESYLIRFSESRADEGGFSLAVKESASSIRHFKIVGDPVAAARERPHNARLRLVHDQQSAGLNEGEGEYGDIVHFLNYRLDCAIEGDLYCTDICPNLPYNALFRGYD